MAHNLIQYLSKRFKSFPATDFVMPLHKQNRFWLVILWVTLVGMGCVSNDVSNPSPETVSETNGIVVSTPSPTSEATPSPVAEATLTPTSKPTLLPTVFMPTPTLEPTATPIPTSTLIEGWLVYYSDYYGFEISYPTDANLEMSGVEGFPTEEQPEDMSATQYLSYLRGLYPDDICLAFGYEGGFVTVRAPLEDGGKYADVCPGLGIGAYELVEQTEEIMVAGASYVAEGFEIRDSGSWLGEFLSVELEDGTSITFGVFDMSLEDYVAVREVLLQIVTSYSR